MNGNVLRYLAGLILLICLSGPVYGQKDILRYGADPVTPAPFPYYPPNDPNTIIGFEIDIIEAIAHKLDMTPVMVTNNWESLIPGLKIGLYDVVMNAVTPTPEKRQEVNFSRPYYITYLQFVVHKNAPEIKTLEDIRGKRIGVVKSSEASLFLDELATAEVLEYENEVNGFNDLHTSRLDAVLYDAPTSIYGVKMHPDLKLTGPHLGELAYSIIVPKNNEVLLAKINQAILELEEEGTLRAIFESWNLWNEKTARYFNDFSVSTHPKTAYENVLTLHEGIVSWQDIFKRYWNFMPILARAAWLTLKISITAMLLATTVGFGLAIIRVYGPGILSTAVSFYVEIIRGTPLLIQLLLIFYGLPSIGIEFSPFWAGVLGLGLNYAAFEAESYRAGLMSVPHGQMEAARALGMSHLQGLRHVVIPQAFRTVLPPITNDFISLLKDSSLVSVITLVELTKAYTQLAIAYYDFFGIGLLVAGIYFAMGLPFVRLARWTEKRLHAPSKRFSNRT